MDVIPTLAKSQRTIPTLFPTPTTSTTRKRMTESSKCLTKTLQTKTTTPTTTPTLTLTLLNQLGIFFDIFLTFFENIGDFDGGSYKNHFQNWQFDVSLLKNFRKKVYFLHHFFKKCLKIFSKFHYMGVMNFF